MGVAGSAQADDQLAQCATSREKIVESREITLQLHEPESSFYFRSGDYVVLATPDLMVKKLESVVNEQGHVYDRRLLANVQGMRTSENKHLDLFLPALADPSLLPHIHSLLIRLIQAGEATIVTTLAYPEDEGRIHGTVILIVQESGGARICTESGKLILRAGGAIP